MLSRLLCDVAADYQDDLRDHRNAVSCPFTNLQQHAAAQALFHGGRGRCERPPTWGLLAVASELQAVADADPGARLDLNAPGPRPELRIAANGRDPRGEVGGA